MFPKHILTTKDFTRNNLEVLFEKTDYVRRCMEKDKTSLLDTLRGRSVDIVFSEPSTRTAKSFQKAAQYLGTLSTDTPDSEKYSSVSKGETIEDTAHTYSRLLSDVLVIRHHQEGSIKRAADEIDRFGRSTHVINAGDGAGQHPTQALLDLYTLWHTCGGKIREGLKVAFWGDPRYGRTVRSLAYLLSKYPGVQMMFVAPDEVQIRQDILDHLDEHGIQYAKKYNPIEVLPEADVVYCTRLQVERMKESGVSEQLLQELKAKYTIGPNEIGLMKEDAILMHPLPRVWEISREVDQDRRVAYWDQITNGLYVRMALLMLLLGK